MVLYRFTDHYGGKKNEKSVSVDPVSLLRHVFRKKASLRVCFALINVYLLRI